MTQYQARATALSDGRPWLGTQTVVASAAVVVDGGFKWSSQHDLCWPIGQYRKLTPYCLTATAAS